MIVVSGNMVVDDNTVNAHVHFFNVISLEISLS
jgi:hypothetical protein